MAKSQENNLPIYLGYCKKENAYYFYGNKEGVGRFLKYSAYFYWVITPAAVLDLKREIPDEINLELNEFLTGRVHYEFVKKRRNSATTDVKKYYRTPPAITPIESLPEPRVEPKEETTVKAESLKSETRKETKGKNESRATTRASVKVRKREVQTEASNSISKRLENTGRKDGVPNTSGHENHGSDGVRGRGRRALLHDERVRTSTPIKSKDETARRSTRKSSGGVHERNVLKLEIQTEAIKEIPTKLRIPVRSQTPIKDTKENANENKLGSVVVEAKKKGRTKKSEPIS